LRRPLSNKKKSTVDYTVDRFNHATDRCFRCPPCLIATIKVFSKFGALEERSYHEIIWLQILKTLREEKNAVRELRRCDERVHMFQCLVMYISLVRGGVVIVT